MDTLISVEDSHIDVLHEIGVRLGTADGFHEVLTRVVEFASALVKCDSCLIYVLEGDELVLRASKNPHPEVVDRLKLRVGQGITGWVAEHREPVAIPEKAAHDPRFQFFHELPEDSYEAFLSVPLMCRGRVVGVINLQHRQHHVYRRREIRMISTVGFLVGAEIELARLEEANSDARGTIADSKSRRARQRHSAARSRAERRASLSGPAAPEPPEAQADERNCRGDCAERRSQGRLAAAVLKTQASNPSPSDVD